MTTSKISIASIFNSLVSMPSFSESRMKSCFNKLSKEQKTFLEKGKNLFLLKKRCCIYFHKLEKSAEQEKEKKEAKQIGISHKRYIIILEKAQKIAKLYDAGYSMGGYINVYLKYINRSTKKETYTYIAGYSNAQEYAKNCSYKAKHGSNQIYLTISEIESIEFVGNIPTIKGELVAPKIYECSSLVGTGSKHNYNIVWEKGFLTSDYHASSIKQAQNWRKKMAEQLLSARRKAIDIEAKKLKFVGFEHSLKAGNCKSGTDAFIQRHQLDKDMGYQLGYIMSLERSHFTERLLSVV